MAEMRLIDVMHLDRPRVIGAWLVGGVLIDPGTPVIIEPPGDGSATEQHRIFDPCRTMSERWRDVTFTLDPAAGGEALAQPRHGSASIRGLREA